MDRRFLEETLAIVEKHVALGEAHIVRQRQIASELRRDGHDPTQSEGLLASFEALQAMHLEHRDRIRLELSRLKP